MKVDLFPYNTRIGVVAPTIRQEVLYLRADKHEGDNHWIRIPHPDVNGGLNKLVAAEYLMSLAEYQLVMATGQEGV